MKHFATLFILAFCGALSAQVAPLDPNFGNQGIVRTSFSNTSSDHMYALAVQPDDKVIVAGRSNGFFPNGSMHCSLARYLPDGALDPDFGRSGKVWSPIGESSVAQSLAFQYDGGIICTGFATFSSPGNATTTMLARYLVDGRLDAGFGQSGYTLGVAPAGIEAMQASTVAVQPDDKIVIGGTARDTKGKEHLLIARYLPNGKPDLDFGSNGIILSSIFPSTNDRIAKVLVQRDERIVAICNSYPANNNGAFLSALRYLPNGEPDLSFAGSGRWTANNSGPGVDALITDEDKLLILGNNNTNGASPIALFRFNTDGSPDGSFGVNGIVKTSFGTAKDYPSGLAIGPDRSIAISGSRAQNNGYTILVARLLADGSPDLHFGAQGYGLTSLNSPYDTGNDVGVQSNGRIVLVAHYLPALNGLAVCGYRSRTSVTSVHATSRQPLVRATLLPNLLTDRGILQCDIEQETPLRVDLCNAQGYFIRNLFTASTMEAQRFNLDISGADLPAGVYRLVVSSDAGKVALPFVVF